MKLHVLFGVAGLALGISASAQTALIKKLDRFSSTVTVEYDNIPAHRKEQLTGIADKIITANLKDGSSSVAFTDATNSNVSQLAQALFQAAVAKKGLPKVNVFSAGNSESKVDFDCVIALRKVGFAVESNNTFGKNPHYMVSYSWSENQIMLFSKKMDNYQIPTANLIVVSLNGNSSINDNSIVSVSELQYGNVNDETVRQIAREMFFIADKVQNNRLLSHQQ